MGFPLSLVQRACVETMGEPLKAKVDWLLQHLEESKSAVKFTTSFGNQQFKVDLKGRGGTQNSREYKIWPP